jgi:hypothetical protein
MSTSKVEGNSGLPSSQANLTNCSMTCACVTGVNVQVKRDTCMPNTPCSPINGRSAGQAGAISQASLIVRSGDQVTQPMRPSRDDDRYRRGSRCKKKPK